MKEVKRFAVIEGIEVDALVENDLQRRTNFPLVEWDSRCPEIGTATQRFRSGPVSELRCARRILVRCWSRFRKTESERFLAKIGNSTGDRYAAGAGIVFPRFNRCSSPCVRFLRCGSSPALLFRFGHFCSS